MSWYTEQNWREVHKLKIHTVATCLFWKIHGFFWSAGEQVRDKKAKLRSARSTNLEHPTRRKIIENSSNSQTTTNP